MEKEKERSRECRGLDGRRSEGGKMRGERRERAGWGLMGIRAAKSKSRVCPCY